MVINLQHQTFDLLPEKAILWKEKSSLLVADLHIGKTTHFRKSGIGIPPDMERQNYENLSTLILNHEVDRVIFLGDLFHSVHNAQWEVLNNMLDMFPEVTFDLVMGNHDILPYKMYLSSRLKIYDILDEPPFTLSHFPLANHAHYNICGHLHPAVVLKGPGKQRLKLPCFIFSERQGVLPSFGAFTGNAVIRPNNGDRVYVVTQDRVISLK